MSESNEQLCPWCQTLITWDPDIGPEEECPHCYNELKGYRSLKLTLGDREEELEESAEEEDDEYDFPADALNLEDLEDFRHDGYGDAVQAIVDAQEEAPECPSCHDFMLHVGTRVSDSSGFVPVVPKSIGEPLVRTPFRVNVFVCPHCFRTDTLLAEEDRLAMTRLLRGDKEN